MIFLNFHNLLQKFHHINLEKKLEKTNYFPKMIFAIMTNVE